MTQGRHRKRTTRTTNRQVGRVTGAVGVAAFIAASAGAANAAPVVAQPGHGSSKAGNGSSASGQAVTKSPDHATKAKTRAAQNRPGGTHARKARSTATPSAPSAQAPSAGGTHQQGAGSTYTVVSGDTLSRIAARYDLSWQELCQVNRLDDCDLIVPGQELTISGVSADTTGGVGAAPSRAETAAESGGSSEADAAGQATDRSTHQVSRSSRSGGRGDSCARPDAAESWIIEHESGGSVHADNPTSSAFGLGQLLLSNRQLYASRIGVSADTTDYCDQLKMFRMYVADRYGSAESARSFWLSHSWY